MRVHAVNGVADTPRKPGAICAEDESGKLLIVVASFRYHRSQQNLADEGSRI